MRLFITRKTQFHSSLHTWFVSHSYKVPCLLSLMDLDPASVPKAQDIGTTGSQKWVSISNKKDLCFC